MRKTLYLKFLLAYLIFGFFGGIFYIYRGVVNPHTAVDL